jgi:hypothetical protein
LRIVEVPIIFTDRLQGSSKMSSKIVREALWMVWRLLFQNKLRRSAPKNPAGTGAPAPPQSCPPAEKPDSH